MNRFDDPVVVDYRASFESLTRFTPLKAVKAKILRFFIFVLIDTSKGQEVFSVLCLTFKPLYGKIVKLGLFT